MGRPRPTRTNIDFVVMFADIVTAKSSQPIDWIARNGEHCLFELLLLLAPKVSSLRPTLADPSNARPALTLLFCCALVHQRLHTQSKYVAKYFKQGDWFSYRSTKHFLSHSVCRGGLTAPQVNKHLEKNGYVRARIRMKSIVRLDAI